MRALLLLAVSATLLSACGSTAVTTRPGTRLDWRIGLDRRMGIVTYGERRNRVEAAIGPGEKTRPHHYRGRWIFYRRAELYIGYYKYDGEDRAIALITHSSRYRTASGVGVGTTVEQLRKRVKIACNSDGFVHGVLTYPNINPDECSYPRDQTDHPFTSFVIDLKRVSEVAIFPGGD